MNGRFCLALLLCMPVLAVAGGDYPAKAASATVTSNAGAYTASSSSSMSSRASGSHRPTVIELNNGSLQQNIQRIGRENGWRNVVWDIPNDYQWVGNTRVVADNLEDALTKVLQNYPVQAIFYQGNHVLLIRPRTLQ